MNQQNSESTIIFVAVKKIFETILPGWQGDVQLTYFPWHVRLFMRITVAVVHFYALKNHFRFFGMLSPQQQHRIIHHLYHHPNASLRSLVQFWKLTAFMTQC